MMSPFQCDGSGLGFSTISAFARMHIIWGDAIVAASPHSACLDTHDDRRAEEVTLDEVERVMI